MVELKETGAGVLLSVRAQPGARKNAIAGEYNQALKVTVTAPPEDGKANDALVRFLAEALGLKRSQVALAAGAASRDKKFLLSGLTLADLRARIDSHL